MISNFDFDEEEINNYFTLLSKNVKKIRIQKGFSQLEVALSIGQKSSGFYANMENNSHGKRFNLIHLYKLSRIFEVNIEDFFKSS